MTEPLEMRPRTLASLVDRTRLRAIPDWLAVAVAVSLPWSTSVAGILIVLWLVAVLPTLDAASVGREMKTTAGGLPVLLWVLAAVGTLWAADASWSERLAGLGGFNKLLLIPLLLAHFRSSERPDWVILGFLASALVLLLVSFGLAFLPGLEWRGKNTPGVPVKDYIAQSEIFAMGAFGLLGLAAELWRSRRRHIALALVCIAAAFIADIGYVATSRTTLVVIAALLVLFGFWQFGWKGALGATLIGGVLAGLLWVSSPYLRERVTNVFAEVELYRDQNLSTSSGARLEYWKKSIAFVAEAPLVGHGTGAVPELFRRAAKGESGEWHATVNPHNQIMTVAIQLGVLGTIVLIAMWIAHLVLFRDATLIAWLGLVIVASNIVSSLFNSHLFDFTQGWIYVFGLGVTGGMARQGRARLTAGGTP